MWNLQRMRMLRWLLLLLLLLSGCPQVEGPKKLDDIDCEDVAWRKNENEPYKCVECAKDEHCKDKGGKVCVAHTCKECRQDSDCTDGEKTICLENTCQKRNFSQECQRDADCPVLKGVQHSCKENKCVKVSCQSSSDCKSGSCHSGVCFVCKDAPCVLGARRCSDGAVQRCSLVKQCPTWTELAACRDGGKCFAGGCRTSCLYDSDCTFGRKCQKSICQVPHWAKMFDSGNKLTLASSLPTSDNNHIIAGSFLTSLKVTLTTGVKKDFGSDSRIGEVAFLGSQSADGRFDWFRTLPQGFQTPNAAAINADDEICVVGTLDRDVEIELNSGLVSLKKTGDENSHGIYVLKVDANGNILWVRSLGDTDETRASAIAVRGDGGCVVTGGHRGEGWTLKTRLGRYTLKSPEQYGSGFVLSLDNKGSVDWIRSAGHRVEKGIPRFYDLKISRQGEIAVLLPGPTFSLFSAIGTPLWKKKIPVYRKGEKLPDFNFWRSGDPQIVINEKGEFYLATPSSKDEYFKGYTTKTKAGDVSLDVDGVLLFKLSNKGELLWGRSLKGGISGALRVQLDAKGDVFIAGRFHRSLENPGAAKDWENKKGFSPFVAKLSSEGKVLWTQGFTVEFSPSGVGTSTFKGVAITPDGSLFLTGDFPQKASLKVGSITLKETIFGGTSFSLKMGADGSLP